MSTIRSMFTIALCVVAGACGSSSSKAPDDKALSDEAFLKKLDAEQKTSPSPAANATPSRVAAVAAPSIAAPKITTATFEPVYRAAKAVQGATTSGVTYVKFGELMQAFSTELGIAKDHELNASDQKLLAIYQEAYEAYHFSAAIWFARIDQAASVELYGAIPLYYDHVSPEQIEHYKLQVVTHGRGIQGPGPLPTDAHHAEVALDSTQRVWQQTDVILESATALYYGKPAPPM